MNSPAGRFNIILVLLFCLSVGCKTTDGKKAKKEDQATFLRFHVESNPDATGRTMQVPVYRARPMLITVQKEPALDEGYLDKVELVDVDEMGGFAFKVTFDDPGRRKLNAVTVENRGLHFAINAVWTESRWIAAPLISKAVTTGEFIFTPDCTREEANRIVQGLRNVIKEVKKPYVF